MKKKGLAVLVLSLALSAGCGMAAMAATGWVSENGKWVYYDSSGGHVTMSGKRVPIISGVILTVTERWQLTVG